MLIRHYKGEPNRYVIRYKNGVMEKDGTGLAFWYRPFNTSIVAIPVGSQDAPFIFNETTSDFQEISIQGQLSFRLTQPLDITKVFDFTIDPKRGNFRSDDPEKLIARTVNLVQAHTRSGVNQLSLEQALIEVKELASTVLVKVQQEAELEAIGIRVESLHFSEVKATPEMRKALEADYRESLQQRADQAIYARRMAAVEEEAKISNQEMDNTVELEERRRELVIKQSKNRLQQAEAEAKALEMEAEAETKADEIRFGLYKSLSPQALLGLALKDWAGGGGSIGNLSISPDLLTDLVKWVGSTPRDSQ